MLNYQLKVELKKSFTLKRITTWMSIIFIPIILKFFMIIEGYTFFRSVEFFQELISGFIPMLFPILMLLIYANNYIIEKKHNFSLYTRTRVWFPTYIQAKIIVNAGLAFFISFFLIFLPFVFIMYVEPHFSIINYQEFKGGYDSYSTTTFDGLLKKGSLIYGIVYSSWVALNGLLYASLAFLFPFFIRNHFIALSLPFVMYHLLNFAAGIFGYAKFSPISTIFPFNIQQQEIWTIFVPFGGLLLVLALMLLMLNRKLKWEN